VNRGVSIYVVQGLLGHTQIKTTQRYAHVSQETFQSAVEVISGYLPGPLVEAESVPTEVTEGVHEGPEDAPTTVSTTA
jgi:hypothetical protein